MTPEEAMFSVASLILEIIWLLAGGLFLHKKQFGGEKIDFPDAIGVWALFSACLWVLAWASSTIIKYFLR